MAEVEVGDEIFSLVGEEFVRGGEVPGDVVDVGIVVGGCA